MKLILSAVFALSVTALSAHADTAFHIIQAQPKLVHIDVGTDGASHGDLMAFEATFTTEDGGSGIMSGILITVDIPEGDGVFFGRGWSFNLCRRSGRNGGRPAPSSCNHRRNRPLHRRARANDHYPPLCRAL